MARKQRKSASKFARPVPGNTYSITMPIEDTAEVPIGKVPTSNTATQNVTAKVRCFNNWKEVQVKDILSKFPILNATANGSSLVKGDFVPVAFKIVSVGVTGGQAYPTPATISGSLYGAGYKVDPVAVGASVKFKNGMLFEQSPESARTMKVKAPTAPNFPSVNSYDGTEYVPGAWRQLDQEILGNSDTVFYYKGELKYITVAFRLDDTADLADHSVA